MDGADSLLRFESVIRCGTREEASRLEFAAALRADPTLALDTDPSAETLLMIAADAGNLHAARALLDAGASPSACSESGTTPIVSVVLGAPDRGAPDPDESLRLAVADLLISAGADVNVRSHAGCSALHLAVIHARVALVRLFMQRTGDPTVRVDDPPSEEDALQLLASGRFRGNGAQRAEIEALIAGRA